jgi:hypothetical protein
MNRVSMLVAVALLLAGRAGAAVPTPRFVFSPGPGADGIVSRLTETAEADRTAVTAELGQDYDGITTVHVVTSRKDFEELLPPDGLAPEWAIGLAFPEANLILMRAEPGAQDPRAIFRHELSHIAVGRLTHGRVPHWFLEGLAIIQAGDAWSKEGPSMIRAGLANDLMPFDTLVSSFPARRSDAELAYAQSADFVQYLWDLKGEAALQDVLRQVVAGSTFDDAVTHSLGSSPRHLENAWRRTITRWVLLLDLLTNRDFLWVVIAVLALVAGWRVRARRRLRMRAQEIEEQEEASRSLLQTPGFWADGPKEISSESASPETEGAERKLVLEGGQEDSEEYDPKKPTLH